jgi:hypothetical protein
MLDLAPIANRLFGIRQYWQDETRPSMEAANRAQFPISANTFPISKSPSRCRKPYSRRKIVHSGAPLDPIRRSCSQFRQYKWESRLLPAASGDRRRIERRHQAGRVAYTLPEIVKWLEVFVGRFFATTQFKRSVAVNGPKVSSGGSLSPRGDWRAPSDSSAAPWLEEVARLKAQLGL